MLVAVNEHVITWEGMYNYFMKLVTVGDYILREINCQRGFIVNRLRQSYAQEEDSKLGENSQF